MAVKTFSAGEQLTASDTNTYLANSGLVYVKSQTIGSNVGSAEITSAFSSTYDSYYIVITNLKILANQPYVGMFMGGSTPASGYYWAGYYIGYASASLSANANSNKTMWGVAEGGNADTFSISITVHNPNLAKNTFYAAQNASTVWTSTYSGYLNDTTQYTSFSLKASTGNLDGGTVTVYGYRKA